LHLEKSRDELGLGELHFRRGLADGVWKRSQERARPFPLRILYLVEMAMRAASGHEARRCRYSNQPALIFPDYGVSITPYLGPLSSLAAPSPGHTDETRLNKLADATYLALPPPGCINLCCFDLVVGHHLRLTAATPFSSLSARSDILITLTGWQKIPQICPRRSASKWP
jgi:hypothetical protein